MGAEPQAAASRAYKVRETFDAASAGYDRPALRFFGHAAAALAEQMQFGGSEHVLDVACGTGAVALACAERLADGRVSGVDLSEGMLEQARAKARARGLGNLDFTVANLESMDLGEGRFDAASCGFGVFFLPDMDAAMRAIARHVKPGGAIGITSFTGGLMEPLSTHFVMQMQDYGVEIPPLSWKRLDAPAKHHALYAAAGIGSVETQQLQVGYPLAGFDEWWDILWFSGYRGLLDQLTAEDLERFRHAHRAEVEQYATSQGIWLDVEVLVSVGRKPER